MFLFSLVHASKLEQAKELYKQGPSKGEEVVLLLREHIQETPDEMEAFRWLGITLYGIGKAEEALPAVEKYFDIFYAQKEGGGVSPYMHMLHARILYELGRYQESKRILEVYWAFWQGNDKLKPLYDYYYPRVLYEIRRQENPLIDPDRAES